MYLDGSDLKVSLGGGVGWSGWVVKLITLSLPTRVEVEMGGDNLMMQYPCFISYL